MLIWGVIHQPVKVFIWNGSEINPDSSILFDRPDPQQIRFLLHSLSSAFFNDILELFHVGNVLMNIFASDQIYSPTDLFCSSSHFFIANFGDERCFFEVSFPIHPYNFGKIHQWKSKTWNENQEDYKEIWISHLNILEL